MNLLKNVFSFLFLFAVVPGTSQTKKVLNASFQTNPAKIFLAPPESAKPGVLWMWMGSNISRKGITKDLEALKAEGFNRTTMFSLSDVTTPWAGYIEKGPTPEIIAWTEPWWKMVRFAAQESKRLGMDFGMFNGPGYTASGGNWITPELSMQELSWSQNPVAGNTHININLKIPKVGNSRAVQSFPVHNPETGKLEKPEVAARKTYYKDIAVIAVPAKGIIPKDSIFNLTDRMQPDGGLEWDAPPGDWIIYRFGHTTRGTLIQPSQWEAIGLECDKMSEAAVSFHMDHVVGEIKKYLGDLIGTGFTSVHFDSYEAGYPNWTPKMREEFLNRRGYDLITYLPSFAKRLVGSKADSTKFAIDFDATVKDLYRDIYFSVIAKKLKEAHLTFLCEPYGGPWRQDEIMPLVGRVMTEFWTHGGKYVPVDLDETVTALRKAGYNIVEAEALTGDPRESKWSETPSWLKSISDAAFCAGVNRLILHRFVEQPWDDKYKPGNTMGQWGTHFDRTQTWWKPAKALVKYWTRCQALLQWGKIVLPAADDFISTTSNGALELRYIHRKADSTDIYFVANTARSAGEANCRFKVTGKQPELWDPVTGVMKTLPQFSEENGNTIIPVRFDSSQSFFIVFRNHPGKKIKGENFYTTKDIAVINGGWMVKFDSVWGGPRKQVLFKSLEDWTKHTEPGIKYYSGTAVYEKHFNIDPSQPAGKSLYLDLGVVNHIASVKLNHKDLGVIWTAPWRIKIPEGLLKSKDNLLEIEVTNVWANRLIGDEQEPADMLWTPGALGGNAKYLKEFPEWFLKNQPRPSKGRYCFTTWSYFTKDDPLVSSGLLGPVRLVKEVN